MIIQAEKRNTPVLVLNARLSEKSAKGHQLLAPLSRQLMRSITVLAAQNQADIDRFKLLGLEDSQAEVVGSIKFDIQLSEQVKERAGLLRNKLNNYGFIWVAGSTHSGEHEQIIAAHKMLCKTEVKSLLIIAPRHPEQFNKVAELLRDEKIAHGRWSENDLVDQARSASRYHGEMLTFKSLTAHLSAEA